jgi:hypothetical protein
MVLHQGRKVRQETQAQLWLGGFRGVGEKLQGWELHDRKRPGEGTPRPQAHGIQRGGSGKVLWPWPRIFHSGHRPPPMVNRTARDPVSPAVRAAISANRLARNGLMTGFCAFPPFLCSVLRREPVPHLFLPLKKHYCHERLWCALIASPRGQETARILPPRALKTAVRSRSLHRPEHLHVQPEERLRRPAGQARPL